MSTALKIKEDLIFKRIHKFLNEHLEKQGFSKAKIKAITRPLHLRYFTYFPYLFNNAFDFFDEDILDKLSVSGFLYYKSVLLIDSIFDKDYKERRFEKYLIANICQEESIKLLSSIFPYNHNLWKLWNLRKSEYAKAYEIDKVSHKIECFEDYKVLCDYKCAFAKIALDSLFSLVGKSYQPVYEKLLKSLKNFHTAFQISDDITDYEEDALNNQFNIVNYQLVKKLVNYNQTVNSYTIIEQKKLVYSTGVSLELHKQALECLEAAAAELLNIDIPLWKFENNKLKSLLVSNYLNIDGFLRVFRTKKNLSNVFNQNNTLNKTIYLGDQFIKKEQEGNGTWHDYFNDGGTSNVWTTAFIITILSERQRTNTLGLLYPKKGLNFIENNMNSDYLWGYNDMIMSDADSTTFTMLALHKNNRKIKKESLIEWFSYQNSDGGFATYRNQDEDILRLVVNEEEADISGWTNSHFCVSAVAYYFLSNFDIDNKYVKEKTKLKNYILHKLDNKKEHYSYWWTNFSYVLSFLIKGSLKEKDNDVLSKSLLLLDQLQNDEVKFNELMSNFFYQGLVLDALCSSKELFVKYKKTIQVITSNMVKKQYNDGSWLSNYCLRIPHISIINPDHQNVWTKDGLGANIIISDYHRLFTSSICLSALNKYKTMLL